MCLAIPGILLSVRDGVGEIDYGGLSAKADLTLTPEAKPGDRRSGIVRWLEALKAGEIKGGPG